MMTKMTRDDWDDQGSLGMTWGDWHKQGRLGMTTMIKDDQG